MIHSDAPAQIRILAGVGSDGSVLVVEDSAPAPSAEDLKTMFERFNRPSQRETDVKESTGLGLSVVQAIVEAHDGRAEASLSELGGLKMSIWIGAKS